MHEDTLLRYARVEASSDTHPRLMNSHPHNLVCAWHSLGDHRGTYIMYSLVIWEPSNAKNVIFELM